MTPKQYMANLKTRWKRIGAPTFGGHVIGGPLAGSYISLHDGGNTLPFTLNGQTGFYSSSKWVAL